MFDAPLNTANLSELEQEVLERIRENEWLALTTELVAAGQPAAENPLDPDMPSGSEAGIAEVVAGKLKAMGLDVSLHEKVKGRPNIIAKLRGTGDGPTLILNSHLDTYPAGDHSRWTACDGNPYRATLAKDRLHARGTSDTRGNLACTLLAVKALRESKVSLKGDLLCVYTVDEEKNGPNGSMYLTKELGLSADYEITAEPTAWTSADSDWGMDIAVCHGGHCLVELETIGTQSHIWRPDSGVNCISHMNHLISALEKMPFSHEPPNRYGSTQPSACVVRMQAGEPREMQFTAYRCTAVAAIVGLVPGMTSESILGDIQALIDGLRKDFPELNARARLYPGSLFVSPTQELSTDAEPVAAIGRAYSRVLGREVGHYRKNAFCDTIRFSEAGMAAVTFGPGEDGWPPVNEYIHTAKVVAAARIYALTVMDILG